MGRYDARYRGTISWNAGSSSTTSTVAGFRAREASRPDSSSGCDTPRVYHGIPRRPIGGSAGPQPDRQRKRPRRRLDDGGELLHRLRVHDGALRPLGRELGRVAHAARVLRHETSDSHRRRILVNPVGGSICQMGARITGHAVFPPCLPAAAASPAETPAMAWRGIFRRNTEPSPSLLVAVITPPCDVATWRATPKPRPTPLLRLVERKSWIINSASRSGGMPTPVSATSVWSAPRWGSSKTRIVTWPIAGRRITHASAALPARLETARTTSDSSTQMRDACPSAVKSTPCHLGDVAASLATRSATPP